MSNGDDDVAETPPDERSAHDVVEDLHTSVADVQTPSDIESASEQTDASATVTRTTTDGGTTQDVSEPSTPTEEPPSGDGSFDGAPDDQEMPLSIHIEEMIKRLGAVIVVMAGVSAVVFWFAPDLINWLWYSYLPGNPENCLGGTAEGTACPRVYHPLGLVFARLKVASLVGFIVALPVFVYQSYLFMRPGLYPHERRYYLAAVPTSLVLAFVGVGFAYFGVLPFIFEYFLYYSEDVANIAFGLSDTFDLILMMMGLFAAVFQIPLFMMLAIMMGVTTRRWLEEKRLYFWLGFSGVAFLFSPDPTGMAPFLVAITMVILFEATLLLLRWTGR